MGARDHILIGGGGSGGHVFPGLAVAAELASRGYEVSWAGTARGMEARLVPQRGLAFHHLPARPLVGQAMMGKARAVAVLGLASVSAWRLVRRLDAEVVVGTGGYVSAPAVLGARVAGRPVLLLEPNAEPGLANRLLARLSTEAVVAHEGTAAHLPCSATVTGVPVRAEFFRTERELPGPPLRILVLGGSQGARQLNELLPRALARAPFANLGDGVAVIRHQAGERHLDATRAAYDATDHGWDVDVVPFIDDVPAAMAGSHLILSRAGAITLSEICAAARPSVLVPLSIAGGHQVGNARRLVEAGAAEMLAPEDAVPEEAAVGRLAAILGRLLGDRPTLERMARAAGTLGRPAAASAIADRVVVLAERGKK